MKLFDLVNQIQFNLRYMKYLGFNSIDCSKTSLHLLEKWNYDKLKIGIENEFLSESLIDISLDVKKCKKCKLCEKRTNIVFGEGNKNARLIFVGEAPGFEEDRTGRPFIGAAGQLLSRIIKSMGLKKNEVYICNVVKCRPPNNRNPNYDEIKECLPYLKRQIASISPKIICILGAVAAKSLLNTNVPISKLRGTFTSYSEMKKVKVIPTYHPAYLLRNEKKKKDVWKDVQKIMRILK